jgi:hypothetical protein
MASKISLIGQISEIDHEIALREKVYPNQIAAGKMKAEGAQMRMDRIHAVRATLEFCRENEADIRAYIAEKKAGRA